MLGEDDEEMEDEDGELLETEEVLEEDNSLEDPPD
jgi:hypothetical protein